MFGRLIQHLFGQSVDKQVPFGLAARTSTPLDILLLIRAARPIA